MCVFYLFLSIFSTCYSVHTKILHNIFWFKRGFTSWLWRRLCLRLLLALACPKPLRPLKNVWFWRRYTKHVKNIFQFNKICKCVYFSPFFVNFLNMLLTTALTKTLHNISCLLWVVQRPLRSLKTLDFGRRRTNHENICVLQIWCAQCICIVVPSTHQFFACDFVKALYSVLP